MRDATVVGAKVEAYPTNMAVPSAVSSDAECGPRDNGALEPLLARPVTVALLNPIWQVVVALAGVGQLYAGLAEILSDSDHVRGACFTLGGLLSSLAAGCACCTRMAHTSRVLLASAALVYCLVWLARIIVVLAGGPCSEKWVGDPEPDACHSDRGDAYSDLWYELAISDLAQQTLVFLAMALTFLCYERFFTRFLGLGVAANILAIVAKLAVGGTGDGDLFDDVALAVLFLLGFALMRLGSQVCPALAGHLGPGAAVEIPAGSALSEMQRYYVGVHAPERADDPSS